MGINREDESSKLRNTIKGHRSDTTVSSQDLLSCGALLSFRASTKATQSSGFQPGSRLTEGS